MALLPKNCTRPTPQERAVGAQRSKPTTTSFAVYHDDFLSLLGPNPSITLAWEDDAEPKRPLAHEAGVYIPSEDSVFVTSNQVTPEGASGKTILISKLTRDPADANGLWHRETIDTDVCMANGGTNHGANILFCAQGSLHGHRSALVSMLPHPPYTATPLLDSFHGREFNSLNDVIVHSDGSIWFTDPIYGSEQGFRPSPQLPNQVYRFEPETGDVRAVADGLGRPNGICFSPGEETVYVTDTDWVHGDGSMVDTRASSIYAYDLTHINSSPFLTSRRLFAFADTGIPDGIKCDSAGNVYSGCGDGLSVWNSGGRLLGKVLVPGGVANFCWGGKGELVLLNEERVWVVRLGDGVVGAAGV